MVNYQAEKHKKQIKIKEESLLVHIAEMDKMDTMDLDTCNTMKELERLLEFSSEEEKQELIDELKLLDMENKTPEEITLLLRTYSEENGVNVRSTSDLSRLEEWLIKRLLNERELYLNTISELKLKQNK